MEKLEYYVVQPSTKLFGGIKVTKETAFDTWNDDKTVHQVFKNGKLTTHIKKETDYNGIKSVETSKLVTEVPEGIVLVWDEETGYIIPNYRMVRPEEAIKILENVEGITKPIEEGTKKAIENK
ncbi:MAG: hypothetical protein ACI4PU_06090 [Intestinibacter sp.]